MILGLILSLILSMSKGKVNAGKKEIYLTEHTEVTKSIDTFDKLSAGFIDSFLCVLSALCEKFMLLHSLLIIIFF